jgi:hypothetical protein
VETCDKKTGTAAELLVLLRLVQLPLHIIAVVAALVSGVILAIIGVVSSSGRALTFLVASFGPAVRSVMAEHMAIEASDVTFIALLLRIWGDDFFGIEFDFLNHAAFVCVGDLAGGDVLVGQVAWLAAALIKLMVGS